MNRIQVSESVGLSIFLAVECAVGMFYDNSSRTCVDCAVGSYQEKEGVQYECMPCAGNKTTASTGSQDIDSCIGKHRSSHRWEVFKPVEDNDMCTYNGNCSYNNRPTVKLNSYSQSKISSYV